MYSVPRFISIFNQEEDSPYRVNISFIMYYIPNVAGDGGNAIIYMHDGEALYTKETVEEIDRLIADAPHV